MASALWAALLVGLMAAAAAAAATPTPAIVNGRDAPRGRFRFMASLRSLDSPDRPFCGGTLIHPRVVLTAAHCLRDIYTGKDRPPTLFLPVVRIGGYNRTTEALGSYQQFQVQQSKIHPQFNTGFTGALTYDLANNDAALLLLPAPCTLPTVALVGPSRKPALPAAPGTRATVVGWGATGYQGSTRTATGPLQMVQQTLLNSSACQEALGEARFKDQAGNYLNVDYRFASNAMICTAGQTAPLQTVCAGDSGGPLLVAGADAAKDYQIGIVSFSAARCDDEYSAYTDVGMVYDWIDRQVFEWTGEHIKPWLPCNQDPSMGCKACAAAPQQDKCASCANPAFVVDASGKCAFKPATGRMLADNKAVGFYRQPVTYNGRIGEAIDIVSAAPFWMLNGRLVRGSRSSTRALGSVSWTYDNRVNVAVINRRLVVTVNGRVQRPGPVVALAAHTKCHFRPDRCYGGGQCDSRRVDIIRPGISIAITQPFIRGGRRGHYADWLEVAVTVNAFPKQQLTGYLGQTILFKA